MRELAEILYFAPWLGAVVGLVQLLISVWIQKTGLRWRALATLIVGLSSILWILYTPYEYRMKEWEKTVSNPIRVDLFFISIALAVSFIMASVATLLMILRRTKFGQPLAAG